MFVGDDAVSAALQQASDANGELLYVNKYGEQKPRSEVEELQVNRKTQKFALDYLTDVRTSVPATVEGGKIPNDMSADQVLISVLSPILITHLITLLRRNLLRS